LGQGKRELVDQLMPLVYDELRTLAHQRLQFERSGHTLNTTALVHEAYIKLVNQERVVWKNRSQFMAVASQAMRRILVDYARRHKADKRGGGTPDVGLDDAPDIMSDERADSLLALDEALTRLTDIDERQSKIVECRFFGGMSIEETARFLEISPATVKREWSIARAWLFRELREVPPEV
jgi:RNA polymerase sigma factor (TIGR02999 family)